MATLPMYRTDVGPMAVRGVFAPGGYEYWGLSVHGGSGLVLLFGYGIRNRAYDRKYRRFMEEPTANRPPMPFDFPLVELVIAGEVDASFRVSAAISVDPDGTRFSSKMMNVIRTGRSVHATAKHEATEVKIDLELDGNASLSARAARTGEHWVEAARGTSARALVVVQGRTVEIAGTGTWSHNFGTRPHWEILDEPEFGGGEGLEDRFES